ncbi:MAG: GNAT family N-acetyltransferase [Myxococcales bacterium]|nr:GNAT family N-acetyltransferase [Myxococcales bacterium]
MKPVLEPYVTRLEDGLWVQIRPLGPDDREALKEGLTHVGNRSLYERFLSPNHKPTEKEIEYLTHPDQRDHLALALGTLDDPPIGIGVARCVREAPGSNIAEYAILIRDDFQGRGAGLLLLAHLAELALENHIDHFRGIQLVENHRILKLTEKIADPAARTLCEAGVLEMLWKLDPDRVRLFLGERREPTSRWKAPLEWLASKFGMNGKP